MKENKLRSTINEAKELGISFIIFVGGEPLVRREILDITHDFPEIVFLIVTNGLLIDEEILNKLQKQRNTIPVISLEGYQMDTDGRRGKGVYNRLQQLIKKLKSGNIFWSVAITVTRSNFNVVTSEEFVFDLVNLGCKLFFFIEYTPVREGTEDWLLTGKQRSDIISLRNAYRSKFGALFIAIPGDEEEIGGCLSAGRGFVHISAEGNVEPCPFAPYSDTNIRDMSLKDALQSDFLNAIRQNSQQLKETEGGCTLWAEREWVRSLLRPK
jgi:MoaA/NifB/PqqE/SkfB family radical SAM enzyme